MFCGDGVPVYGEVLKAKFGERYVPAPRSRFVFPALGAAYLCLQGDIDPVSAYALKANYLRLSEAERHKKEADSR